MSVAGPKKKLRLVSLRTKYCCNETREQTQPRNTQTQEKAGFVFWGVVLCPALKSKEGPAGVNAAAHDGPHAPALLHRMEYPILAFLILGSRKTKPPTKLHREPKWPPPTSEQGLGLLTEGQWPPLGKRTGSRKHCCHAGKGQGSTFVLPGIEQLTTGPACHRPGPASLPLVAGELCVNPRVQPQTLGTRGGAGLTATGLFRGLWSHCPTTDRSLWEVGANPQRKAARPPTPAG